MPELYDNDFFASMASPQAFYRQGEYAKAMVKTLNLTSLIEFGCGCGGWLLGARKAGVKKLCGLEYGYEDAKKHFPEDIGDCIEYGDLSKPINKGKFDCALSIEVVEHVPFEASDTIVDNLVNAAEKYIFLSAATPGQGGIGHINEQPHAFWIDKIQAKGFIYKPDLAHEFRVNLMPMKYRRYLKRNTMIFEKI